MKRMSLRMRTPRRHPHAPRIRRRRWIGAMSGRLLVCLRQLRWHLRLRRWSGGPARAGGHRGQAGSGAGTSRHRASLLGATSPRVACAHPRLAVDLLRRGGTPPGEANLLAGRRDAIPHPVSPPVTRRARGHAPRGGARHGRTDPQRGLLHIRGRKQRDRTSPPAAFSPKLSGAAMRLRSRSSPHLRGARGLRLL